MIIKLSRSNFPQFILSLLILTILLLFVIITVLFGIHTIWTYTKASEISQEFQKKSMVILPIFTTIFDQAEQNNVRLEVDRYDKDLGYGNSVQGRRPIYFIRLKNNYVQKLFQSGDLINEEIDTRGEYNTVEILQGTTEPLQFPQYTCCGPDDIWLDIPILGTLLPERTYLKDFYSELEIVIPIKNLVKSRR